MNAIITSKAPGAIGPYSQAIRTGNLIFVSGQLPVDPSTGHFAEGGIKELTRQSLLNIQTVFLADMADFAAMNEVYAQFFEAPFPARSAVAIKTLPKNARVEIECIAEV